MRLLMQLSGKCQKIRNRNKSWHKHKIIVSANKLARSTLSLYIKKLLRSVPITRRNTVFLFAAVAMLFWNLVGLVYPIYDAIVLGYPLGLDVLFFSDMQWFWPYDRQRDLRQYRHGYGTENPVTCQIPACKQRS